MPEQVELDTKVEKILVKKAHLIYAIVIITITLVSIFTKIQADIALISERQAATLVSLNEIKDEIIALRNNKQDIAVIKEQILTLQNKLR